jgi:hypothetical protein
MMHKKTQLAPRYPIHFGIFSVFITDKFAMLDMNFSWISLGIGSSQSNLATHSNCNSSRKCMIRGRNHPSGSYKLAVLLSIPRLVYIGSSSVLMFILKLSRWGLYFRPKIFQVSESVYEVILSLSGRAHITHPRLTLCTQNSTNATQ